MPKKLPPIPDEKQLKLRKTLSAPGLLTRVRNEFNQIPEHRCGKVDYLLPDVLMSGLAMFALKYPSLLQFDQARHENTIKTNLKNLYGVKKSPCDTQMREVLDPIKPNDLRPAYISIHRQLQRQKVLESYQYLGGYIVSLDGSGLFSSNPVKCQDCCSKNLRNGKKQYYHQLLGAVMLHPDKSNVLPLFPEAITRQDGESKNDCERNASKRLLPAIREAFPQLKIIIVEDALASNAPHLRLLEDLKYSYILVAKPADHDYLFRIIEEYKEKGPLSQLETIDSFGTIRRYNYINNIPLNASHPNLFVNFLEYWEVTDRETIYHNTWITDIE